MSGPQEKWWSDNPNAPKISHRLYTLEKVDFAAALVAAILYGMLVVLFFQCMTALLSPVNRRGERIQWGLISYTLAVFSFVTACTAIKLNIRSLSFIDNREFTDHNGTLLGPSGYQSTTRLTMIGTIANLLFALNNWLADGLLLYRCYIIYATNLWVVAFPCLAYLTSLAMGIALLVYQSLGSISYATVVARFGIPYLSISVSINILLTLMIVIRLALRCRGVHTALGARGGIGGLCKTVITMLVESCALFTVSSLSVIVPSVTGNSAVDTFILVETQAIAPLLVVRRVANKSALTNDIIAPETISSFRARTQEGLASDNGAPHGEDATSLDDKYGDSPPWVETTIDIRRDSAV